MCVCVCVCGFGSAPGRNPDSRLAISASTKHKPPVADVDATNPSQAEIYYCGLEEKLVT